MRKELRLYAHPDEMSDQDIQKAFRDQQDTRIIRAIIWAEIKYIRDGGTREERTLRGFWYDVVKPCLSRGDQLHKNKSRGNISKTVDWDDKLSIALEEMVTNGEVSYEELSIVDKSRRRRLSDFMAQTTERVTFCGPHYPGVILMVEKNTVYSVVESVAELYGCSALCAGGEPALSCTEDFIKNVIDHPNFDGKILLLAVTDWDKTGITIYDSQVSQVVSLFYGAHERLQPCTVDTR